MRRLLPIFILATSLPFSGLAQKPTVATLFSKYISQHMGEHATCTLPVLSENVIRKFQHIDEFNGYLEFSPSKYMLPKQLDANPKCEYERIEAAHFIAKDGTHTLAVNVYSLAAMGLYDLRFYVLSDGELIDQTRMVLEPLFSVAQLQRAANEAVKLLTKGDIRSTEQYSIGFNLPQKGLDIATFIMFCPEPSGCASWFYERLSPIRFNPATGVFYRKE